ncbi:hypothetical protein MLC59_06055 [Marinobacter bryozoorum]|uniref:hypothetical protein n=1 Tax=Marinobacter bryozoorum TaxID=256324 RepID=UPI00200428A1|nr:hypothetical protein [Marinobacter bryozoorum]MCK7543730.1 hypothetical protein [Marinobacter bryozoorum]
MKIVLFAFFLTLAGCSSLGSEFRGAVAYGQIRDLNGASPDIEKPLFVRLIEVPIVESSCYPETRGTCRFQYYLTVSTFDEQPETNVFRLGQRGQVHGVAWRESGLLDTAVIDLQITKYSRVGVEANLELEQESSTVRIRVTPNAMEEVLLRR